MRNLLQNKLLQLFLFLGIFISDGLQGQPSHKFTLNDCLEYGFNNQASVQNAALERNHATALVGETRADGLPQINADIEYSNYFSIQKAFLPSIIFDPNASLEDFVAIPFSQKYNGTVTLSGTQLLFDGSYFVGLRAAKTLKLLREKDHIKSQQDAAEMITKAYYTVLVNQVALDLINNNHQRLDTLLRETTLMYENGFAEKIDVSRVQVQFNNVQVQQQKTERALVLAYHLLKYQMGMPISEHLQLVESIEDINLEILDYDLTGFRYQDRIEIGQLETTRNLAQLELKNNQVEYLPKLTGFATLGANAATNTRGNLTDFDQTWLDYGIFGLRLNIPIFDGLRKSYLVQQNRIQLAQIDNDMRQLKNGIDLDLEQAKGDFANSLENLEAQEENMKLAEEVYRVTRIKYQEGIGSNLEVVDAESSYKEAQTNYFNALYDALIAKVDIEKALGILYIKPSTE